jgi:hypothetical protein
MAREAHATCTRENPLVQSRRWIWRRAERDAIALPERCPEWPQTAEDDEAKRNRHSAAAIVHVRRNDDESAAREFAAAVRADLSCEAAVRVLAFEHRNRRGDLLAGLAETGFRFDGARAGF